jgi:hypothetical protein
MDGLKKRELQNTSVKNLIFFCNEIELKRLAVIY